MKIFRARYSLEDVIKNSLSFDDTPSEAESNWRISVKNEILSGV